MKSISELTMNGNCLGFFLFSRLLHYSFIWRKYRHYETTIMETLWLTLLDHDFGNKYSGCIYYYTVNNGKSTKNLDLCLKLLAKTLEQRQRHHSVVNVKISFKIWSRVSLNDLEQAIFGFFLNPMSPMLRLWENQVVGFL